MLALNRTTSIIKCNWSVHTNLITDYQNGLKKPRTNYMPSKETHFKHGDIGKLKAKTVKSKIQLCS